MPVIKDGNVKKNGLQRYRVKVNYTDENGKYRQLCRIAYGQEAAKLLYMKLQMEMSSKGNSADSRIELKELFEKYVAAKKFEVRQSTLNKTIQQFRHHVPDSLLETRLDKITTKQLQEWKLSIEEKELAVTTKKNVYAALRAVFNFGVQMDYLQRNPLNKINNFKDPLSIKKEMEYYTAEEFSKFISAAKDFAIRKEREKHCLFAWNYHCFFAIAFFTGLRKGEIHALRWSDISGCYLSVSRSLNQKLGSEDVITPPKNSSSYRTIQIPKPLMEILDAHKKRAIQLPGFSEDDFILGDGKSLRDTTIQKYNMRFAKIANVKCIRIHDFRHSHASLLANSGINIQEVARRLGHARIELTWNLYSHLYPKEEEKAIKVLDGVGMDG